MEIVGKVIQVLPLQQGTSTRTGNPWTIKTFILETQENYPRKVAIEIFGDQRIADNPAEVDQVVTVSFDLESREFNGRWYTSVRAWKVLQGVQTTQAAAPVQPVSPAAPAAPTEAPAEPVTNTFDAVAAQGDDTDLPF
ncbi:MAG: DUF3127 domain-containing protein [Bacteroidales bacterium]|jgi:hypothetical protein|nr:DUF3127 domain-containing protein [Bacteroidales bacterium]MBO7545518.1 DUF3127 domain-containing protein [Paludibacteraceae bacterium]MBQ2607824.1 DUF3127 domain-containing protein [Paludibacteraceae bacterium]MBQ3914830.1 DUF3127 domain-containing protein [Paludibacteraceae bacterium]MBQ7672737.1 DUF3127 domain-containing protein [Paludibacteraceae bacterium]